MKNNYAFCLIVSLFWGIYTHAQVPKLVWAKSNAIGAAISVNAAYDNVNGLYIMGIFRGTADFDPGSGVKTLNGMPPFNRAAYQMKIDTAGSFNWAQSFGGSIQALTTDSKRSIIAFGNFRNTVDLDPGPAISQFTAASNNIHGFIQKIDSNGRFQWAKALEGGGR